MPPFVVNFSAFEMRFRSTWLILNLSMRTTSLTSRGNSTPRAGADDDDDNECENDWVGDVRVDCADENATDILPSLLSFSVSMGLGLDTPIVHSKCTPLSLQQRVRAM